MPARTLSLVNNEIYHIVNRGNASIPIFKNKYDYRKFLQTFCYYQNDRPPIRFSKIKNLTVSEKNKLFNKLNKQRNFLVEVIAYCLMPNHYHFILKQIKDEGISDFIRLSMNSYSRYFNTKYKRKGGLFEGRFKAIRIETNNQLLHLARYIHLNPYSSFLVKNFKDLFNYSFSSLPEYLGFSKIKICSKEIVLNQFSTPKEYKKFILNHADYQKTLEIIKHQVLESW